MKSYKLNVTKRSINLIKELRSYKWSMDRAGNQLNVPIDFNNHGIDSARYAVEKLVGKPKLNPVRLKF
jgi:phage terminase large subunit